MAGVLPKLDAAPDQGGGRGRKRRRGRVPGEAELAGGDPVKLYAALVNEPYLLTPRQIGRLTDRQIWELYVQPAIERQKEHERQTRGWGNKYGTNGVPDRFQPEPEWKRGKIKGKGKSPGKPGKSSKDDEWITPRDDAEVTDDKGRAMSGKQTLRWLARVGFARKEDVERTIAEAEAIQAAKRAGKPSSKKKEK